MENSSVASEDLGKRELEFYEGLAHHWWDSAGPFWPLHRLNALRVQWILQNLEKLNLTDAHSLQSLRNLRVLDIGCGGGILSEALAKLGAQVHGVDVSQKSLMVAQKHAQWAKLDIRYENASVESLVERGAQYDIVFNMEVVEHVADVDGFLTNACKLVRPRGLMFLASINRTLSAAVIAIFAAEYLLRYLPRGTHHYRQLVKPSEAVQIMEASGLSAVNWTGVGVNPFKRSMYLRSSLAVNYMLCAVK